MTLLGMTHLPGVYMGKYILLWWSTLELETSARRL